MAENAGIYDRTGEAAGTVLNFFLSLSQQSWLRVTALTLGCFLAGLLLERRLEKLDRSRTEQRKNLGFEMIKLGYQLRFTSARNLIADYLMDVGTMLIDGHFSEAKQHAESRKAAFTSVHAK
jgi:hypothetical protein